MSPILIVTAVAAERDACQPRPAVNVVTAGGGPAAAAAATAYALAAQRYDLALAVGIAGGFPPAAVGDIIVARRIVFADLGAEDADGFLPLSSLGFGTEEFPVDGAVWQELARRTSGWVGTVLTVATVTGTTATAERRASRYPDGLAEAMEGAGVADAARRAGVPFGEVRVISNLVGPRDRDAWRIPEALKTLGDAVTAIGATPWTRE
jgi:futalosine hydrolase